MIAKEIFDNLCMFRDSGQKMGMSPIKMKKMGVRITEMCSDSINSDIDRTKYDGDDGGYVIEEYASSDRSRSYDLRSDLNHFTVILYDDNGIELDKKTTVTLTRKMHSV